MAVAFPPADVEVVLKTMTSMSPNSHRLALTQRKDWIQYWGWTASKVKKELKEDGLSQVESRGLQMTLDPNHPNGETKAMRHLKN